MSIIDTNNAQRLISRTGVKEEEHVGNVGVSTEMHIRHDTIGLCK
jgi:hypothetical protein